MRLILGLIASTAFVVGCADGNSVLSLKVSTPDILTTVDHITITVTDTARNAKSNPARYGVAGGMIPPAQVVALVLPRKIRGSVHVDASVEAADGTVLGVGGGDYAVTPSKQATGDLVVRSVDALPDAMMSTVTVDRSTGVVANNADAAVVTVTLRNLHGEPLAGVAVQVTASGSGASLSAPDPTGLDGSTTSSLRSTVAETKTVTATALSVTLAQQPSVQFVSGGPATLAFAVQPIRGYAQKVMSTVKVQIQDSQGNVIPAATNRIALALAPNSANASIIGVTPIDAVAGVATFDVVGVDKSGQGFVMTALSPGLTTAASVAFNMADYPWQLVTSAMYGGDIQSIAVAPALGSTPVTLFAQTLGGVYVSTNLAGSWSRADFGLSASGAVTIDPSTPGTAFTGGGAFIMKTTNAGGGWKTYGTGTPGINAYSIVVNPSNPALVYAGNDVNLFKSTDGGKHWAATNWGHEAALLAIDPSSPSTTYVAGYTSGLFKSTDGGASWASINNGLPTPNIQSLYSLPSGLFVTTQSTILRSTDQGTTWTDMMTYPGQVAAAPSNPMTVYFKSGSNLKISTDGGVTFPTSKSIGQVGIRAFVVHPTNANELFAATTFGVFHSTDAGTTWMPASIGISNLRITAIALVGANVLVGASSQIYRSMDAGDTWVTTTLDPNDRQAPIALTNDHVNANRYYQCTPLGFHISTDGGATWGPSTSATGNCSRALFPSTGGIFVGSNGSTPGIYKSADLGMTWTTSPILMTGYGVFSIAGKSDGTTLFVGANPQGIYRSTDSGATWTNIQNTDVAMALAYDDTDPQHVFSGLNCTTSTGDTGGFRISSDTGTTWGPLIKPGTCVASLIDVANLFRLMATARVNNVATFLSSSDKGLTWSSIPIDTFVGLSEGPIAASYDTKNIFVGTTAGLYRSATGGL